MSGYRVISAHVDPQHALLPDPVAVMLFDGSERGWDQMPPVCCRIDPERARELGGELLWLADYAERLAREQGATR
jgi:hypothetical protein